MSAWLVPLAWTPIGVVLGENWQRVGIAADNLAGWTDQTFDWPGENLRLPLEDTGRAGVIDWAEALVVIPLTTWRS